MIDNAELLCYTNNVLIQSKRFGGIAQLGERLTGSQEVSGSIPLISTTEKTCFRKKTGLFLHFQKMTCTERNS